MNNPYKEIQLHCDNSYNQLYYLESILQLTKDVCQEKEFGAIYYNLPPKYKFILSEERNHYINMIDLALDKVANLKQINNGLENDLANYKSTPTIAADK